MAAVEFFRRQHDGTGPHFDEFFESLTAHEVEFILNKRAAGRLKDLADVEALGEE